LELLKPQLREFPFQTQAFERYVRVEKALQNAKDKDDEHIGEGEQGTEKMQQNNRSVSEGRIVDKTCGCDVDRYKRRMVNRKKASRHGGERLMMGYRTFYSNFLTWPGSLHF